MKPKNEPVDIMKKLNLTVDECEKLYKGAMNTENNYMRYAMHYLQDKRAKEKKEERKYEVVWYAFWIGMIILTFSLIITQSNLWK